MKTEEIQDRLERCYTMAIYGTRENIHEQMTNDIKTLLEAINYTRCSTLLPDELQPVLAKIEHTNSLGTSNYWEVVYYDNKNWHSYQGSKTFEDGEKVVKWNYCKAIV